MKTFTATVADTTTGRIEWTKKGQCSSQRIGGAFLTSGELCGAKQGQTVTVERYAAGVEFGAPVYRLRVVA